MNAYPGLSAPTWGIRDSGTSDNVNNERERARNEPPGGGAGEYLVRDGGHICRVSLFYNKYDRRFISWNFWRDFR